MFDIKNFYILLINDVLTSDAHNSVQLFGSSVNDNLQLAKTVLIFRVVCLYVGPKVLVKRLF